MPRLDEYNSPSGVSNDELRRRRAILERDRAAALVMEPGIPEFAGPGAAAGAVASTAGAANPGGGSSGEDVTAQAAKMVADKFLWTTVWEDITGLSLLGLNILAFKSGMKGWALWKKFALIVLDLLGMAIATILLLLVLGVLCLGDSTCRLDLFAGVLDDVVGIIKGIF